MNKAENTEKKLFHPVCPAHSIKIGIYISLPLPQCSFEMIMQWQLLNRTFHTAIRHGIHTEFL